MIGTILDGLLPVAFVVSLGWLAGRLGLLRHEDADVLATYVVRFALPLSLFQGAVSTAPSDLLDFGLLGALAVALIATFGAGFATGRWAFRRDVRTSAIQGLACSFPDMAYFSAPVMSALYGPSGFLPILLGNLVVMLVMLPATIMLTNDRGNPDGGGGAALIAKTLLGAITNPIVWVPLAGVVLCIARVKLPNPIDISVATVGKSAGGTSLFALGLMLYGAPIRINRDVLANLAIKNILQPAIAVLASVAFLLPGSVREQALLTAAAPTATAATMFALKSRTYTGEATSTVFVSTIAAIFINAIIIYVVRT
jgi:malonate transporter and related proteins